MLPSALTSPEIDFDVEEYEGDEGRDAEKEGLAKVHVVLDVDRVVPGKDAQGLLFYFPFSLLKEMDDSFLRPN